MTGDGGACHAAYRRLVSRASARRDALPVVAVLTLFALLLLRDFSAWLRDEATRRDALRLYSAAPREELAHAGARLCLRGLGVPRDTLGDAAWAPLPPPAPPDAPLSEEGDGLLPGVVRGQFRRLPRVGARGLPPGALHYGMWNVDNFTGDFVMTKSKYGRRVPGARLALPRPVRECAAATPEAAAKLPAVCDAAAARAGRAQGYAPVGEVTHTLLAAVPDRDPLRLFPRFASCALVGPHAARGAPGAGAAIDAAAAVFRVAGPDGRVVPQPEALAGRHTHVLVLGPDASAAAVAGGTLREEEGLHEAQRAAPLRLHVVTSAAALNATLRWQQQNPFSNAAVVDADLHQLALDLHGALSCTWHACLSHLTLLHAQAGAPLPRRSLRSSSRRRGAST